MSCWASLDQIALFIWWKHQNNYHVSYNTVGAQSLCWENLVLNRQAKGCRHKEVKRPTVHLPQSCKGNTVKAKLCFCTGIPIPKDMNQVLLAILQNFCIHFCLGMNQKMKQSKVWAWLFYTLSVAKMCIRFTCTINTLLFLYIHTVYIWSIAHGSPYIANNLYIADSKPTER